MKTGPAKIGPTKTGTRRTRAATTLIAAAVWLVTVGPVSPTLADAPSAAVTDNEAPTELDAPVRLAAQGEPIDIGVLSKFAHAGPWIADVDDDGDRDLVVGDFPGYFWLFENEGDDSKVRYAKGRKLEAGGRAAKTPVY